MHRRSDDHSAVPPTTALIYALAREAGVVPRSWPPELRAQAYGFDNAYRVTELLLQQGAGLAVSFGVAGGLSPTAHTGDVLLPDTVICKDVEHAVDPALLEAVRAALASRVSVHVGRHLAASEVVTTPSEKRRLFASTGALGVDLESGGVAEAARARGASFLVLRVVSDDASALLPAEVRRWTGAEGRVDLARLLSDVLRRPTILRDLPSMGRAFNKALASLQVVGEVLERMKWSESRC